MWISDTEKHIGEAVAPVNPGATVRQRASLLSPQLPGVSCVRPLLHVDGRAHPRMNTALKLMLALRQAIDLQLAALQNSRSGHGDIRKAIGAFGHHFFSPIQLCNKSAAEFRHFRERVRFTALIHDGQRCTLFDFDGVRLKVPIRIGSSSGGLRE